MITTTARTAEYADAATTTTTNTIAATAAIATTTVVDVGSGLRSKSESITKCMVTKPMPTSDIWREAYTNDKDTNFIIGRKHINKTPLTEDEIRKVHASYREPLRQNQIFFRNDRLLFFTSVAG